MPLEGNSYSVDPALTGRRVELRYDPENLALIEVFLDGRPAGAAVPFVIGRHVHKAHAPAPPPAADPTGIDYLGMVAAAHDEQAAPARRSTPPSSPACRTRRTAWLAGAIGRALRLARTPFGKAIAAKDLFARQAHAQATARISFSSARPSQRHHRGCGGRRCRARRGRRARPDPAPGHLHRRSRVRHQGLYLQVVQALGPSPSTSRPS